MDIEKIVEADAEEVRFQILLDKLELLEETIDNNLDVIADRLDAIDTKLKELSDKFGKVE